MDTSAEIMRKYLISIVTERLLTFALIRYLIVGGTLFFIDLFAFLGFVTLLGWTVPMAQLTSRTIGGIVGFFGHKYFSFGTDRDEGLMTWATKGGAYTAVLILNIAVSPFLVYGMYVLLDGDLIMSKVISEIVMFSGTFIFLRYIFLFGRERDG